MQMEKMSVQEQEVRQINKETLLAAKTRLEQEIERFTKKELNDHSRSLSHTMHEINAALSTMQDMMNLLWKRTEQMHEELAVLRSKTE